jgi:hypothetical protein
MALEYHIIQIKDKIFKNIEIIEILLLQDNLHFLKNTLIINPLFSS